MTVRIAVVGIEIRHVRRAVNARLARRAAQRMVAELHSTTLEPLTQI